MLEKEIQVIKIAEKYFSGAVFHIEQMGEFIKNTIYPEIMKPEIKSPWQMRKQQIHLDFDDFLSVFAANVLQFWYFDFRVKYYDDNKLIDENYANFIKDEFCKKYESLIEDSPMRKHLYKYDDIFNDLDEKELLEYINSSGAKDDIAINFNFYKEVLNLYEKDIIDDIVSLHNEFDDYFKVKITDKELFKIKENINDTINYTDNNQIMNIGIKNFIVNTTLETFDMGVKPLINGYGGFKYFELFAKEQITIIRANFSILQNIN